MAGVRDILGLVMAVLGFFASFRTWVVSLWRKPPVPKTPEEVLDESIRKMTSGLRRSKAQVKLLLESQKSLQDQINVNINKVTRFQVKALEAVGQKQEQRARDLLRRKQSHEKTVKALQDQLDRHKAVSESLQETIRRLELQLDETKRKRLILTTQKQTYETTRLIQDNLDGFGEEESVGQILSALEEDVTYLQTEAQLSIGQDMDELGPADVQALPPAPASELPASVEDELASLKKRLGGGSGDDDDDSPEDDGIIFIE